MRQSILGIATSLQTWTTQRCYRCRMVYVVLGRGVPNLGTSISSASQTCYKPAFRWASAILQSGIFGRPNVSKAGVYSFVGTLNEIVIVIVFVISLSCVITSSHICLGWLPCTSGRAYHRPTGAAYCDNQCSCSRNFLLYSTSRDPYY